MTTTVRFETTECSRCGGTGHYSFNMMTGSACFKCNPNGRQHDMVGKQLTPAGRAARKAFDAAYDAACRQVVVTDLQPGDRVLAPTRRKATVVSVEVVPGVFGNPDGTRNDGIQVNYLRTAMIYKADTVVTVVTPEAFPAAVARVRRFKGAIITEEVSA